MDRLEVVCRALCDFDGREPDFVRHGVPAWRRYEAKALTVLNALTFAAIDSYPPNEFEPPEVAYWGA